MRSDEYRAKAQEMASLAAAASEEMRDGYLQLEKVWSEMADVAAKAEKIGLKDRKKKV